MNEIRKLIETIEKIEEGYFKELDIDNQERAAKYIKLASDQGLGAMQAAVRTSFEKEGQDVSNIVYKTLHDEYNAIEPRFPKRFDSGRWALDYAKEFGGVTTRRGIMDYEVVAKELEEDDEGALNDRYDDETLNCKHCGDYYCTSKFGGECPEIQRDLFDEDDNSDLEDDSFFNDEEYEKIKQAMAKRGHTPHSLGSNKKGQAMAKDDLAVGAPEYTFDEYFNVIDIEFVGPDADEGASEIHPDADFDDWLTKNPFESIEEGIKEVYISEDWPHQEETHAEMVEYWKASLSQSIVRKDVFTQLFDAANRDIDELNAAIAEQAESIADSYHGTGEGIGSSDINHFIAHIGSSLGIEDLFGWRKKSLEKTGLLDDDIDEDVGNWIKRLDKKAGDWISAKAAQHMAKKVAKAVDEEGADSVGFDLSFGNKKGNQSIVAALETYLENEPEGEYAEQIRYVLPAQAKERGKWDDIMRQAEEVFGFDVRESVNEGVFDWAADKLMDKVVKEINKVGMDSVVVSLTARADSMCHSLKTYLQARDPEEIGIEKYGKLIKLRQMLNCEGRVNEAVVKVPRSLRGTDPDNSLGGTSQEAEDFVNRLGPDDTVSTDVVDPETGELLDWPDKGTRRALGQKQYKRDELAKQKDADNDYEQGWDSPVLYAPNIDRNPDSAFDAINQLKYDREFLDFYNIVWKQIEDLVDAPETYAESDYDIGYEVPTAIKRTDGKKFGDQDHENFRLLNKLYRAGTYNIGLAYAGATDSGTVARFYPTFH